MRPRHKRGPGHWFHPGRLRVPLAPGHSPSTTLSTKRTSPSLLLFRDQATVLSQDPSTSARTRTRCRILNSLRFTELLGGLWSSEALTEVEASFSTIGTRLEEIQPPVPALVKALFCPGPGCSTPRRLESRSSSPGDLLLQIPSLQTARPRYPASSRQWQPHSVGEHYFFSCRVCFYPKSAREAPHFLPLPRAGISGLSPRQFSAFSSQRTCLPFLVPLTG